MTINVSDYINVRERVLEFGCMEPDGIALLPINFDTATSIADLRHLSEGATVKTLLRSANIPQSDILPADKRPPYIQNNGIEWIGPTLFVSAALISSNPHLVSISLGVIADYLTDFYRGMSGDEKISLEFVVEKSDKKTCKKLSYQGTVDGLTELADVIRTITDE